MIRLSIVLLHSFTAATTATSAVFALLQAVANRTWELGFYGTVSGLTASLHAGAVALLVLAVAHAVSAVTWFLGVRRAGWGVVAATAWVAGALPVPLAALLVMSSVLVLLDMMVQAHRDRPPDGPAA